MCYEKATKIWKNLPLFLSLLSKFQKRWEIFSNSVAFSQYLNFIITIKNELTGKNFCLLSKFLLRRYGNHYIYVSNLDKQKYSFSDEFFCTVYLAKLWKCFLFLEEEKFLDETGAWFLAKYVCWFLSWKIVDGKNVNKASFGFSIFWNKVQNILL